MFLLKPNSLPSTSRTTGFEPDVVIYTDGGCHNNGPRKGDGAWAFVEYHDGADEVLVHCGTMVDTTNNRAEMMAIIQGIQYYAEHTKVLVISDSGYCVKGYNHPAYLDTWMRNGWKTSTGNPVLNPDLWLHILGLTYNHGVKFQLIRGHYKDPNPIHALWNSIVDRACTNIIKNNIMVEHAVFAYNFETKQFTRSEEYEQPNSGTRG